MPRILIIEDDEDVRDMLAELLSTEGHQVDTAQDGAQGWAAFRANPADLVITDIVMPEQEGLATIRQLNKEYPDVPVIAISGGGRVDSQEYLEMASVMGASATLAKPFSHADILSLVDRFLPGTD